MELLWFLGYNRSGIPGAKASKLLARIFNTKRKYMKERRLAREAAMQILFQWESQGILMENTSISIDNINIEFFLKQFLITFYPKPEKVDSAFALLLLKGISTSLSEVDSLIEKHSEKWKLSRMNSIDRAILRVACYELTTNKTDPKIVINEAIEIAKRYGSEQSAGFTNGILDSIKAWLSTK